VFETIGHEIREELRQTDKIVFESRGLTDYFDKMFRNSKKDFSVVPNKILVDEEICLQRVKTRDQSIQMK
jgi:hypothetical protein